MPDQTLSQLSSIRTKIRRLTRNPSPAQIADATINDYINNFVLYGMPAYLKVESLKKVLTFYTSPNEDTYQTNTTDATDPLYNFKNKYTNVLPPIYIAGLRTDFYQSTDEFYNVYPQQSHKTLVETGNGVTTAFTGTLEGYPVMKNMVTFSTVDVGDNVLIVPDDGYGAFTGPIDPLSTINYSTGQYYVNFTTAPADGKSIWAQAVPYTASKPITVLYFNNKFILRPIPDITYRVDVTVYQRPTELTNDTDLPELSEWWEYIAYGAAIKILQDRLDMDTANLLMTEFHNQAILVNRRKIIQNASRRTSTIYSNSDDSNTL